jgi:branched-chain amino acid transport system ATP-binding protein
MTRRLEIDGLSVARGAKTVLSDVSMAIESGKIVALLGPNGAGKSSLVLALSGLLPVAFGTVCLDGTRLDGRDPHRIRQAGVACVPEGHQVLTKLSVRDNIEVAADGDKGAFARACAVFPELEGFADRPADTLSGGQQQMVALAQALVAEPAFILADEMSLGLAPVVVRRLMGVVEAAAKDGIGVLLIEQFTHLALEIADHAYVLDRGRIRFDGSPAELKANPQLLEEAYLAASG